MSEEVEKKLKELEELVENMDVPSFRCRSVKWLSQNLGVRNSGHPDFEQAMKLVTDLNKMGIA
jgi:hypothetical protein